MTARVVLLTTYFRPVVGGVESNAERLARFLQRAGFPVRVVTKRVTTDIPDAEVIDGVSVDRIGPRGNRSAAGKWSLTPFAFGWLLRHAAEDDVVCVVDYRGIGLAALAARALRGRPVVFQGQTTGVLSGDSLDGPLRRWGLPPDGRVGRALKWPARLLYRQANALACISRVLEREALACGFPRDRVHFIPNAVDMTRFHPAAQDGRGRLRRDLQWPEDPPVCLFVGRLSREKGVLDLLDAWKLLQPAAALLAIAGPDMPGHPWNAGPEARAFVDRHRLASTVTFLGPIDNVARVLRAADVLVQPSHFEAQGLSAVEALATGVPVVASAVGGLLDFIVDGVNGRLCAPCDAPALAEALRSVILDAPLRHRLAEGARASVLEDYDERAVFSRFASLLCQLAGASA